MGGTDDPSNLVSLTIEEHAEAHRKLWEQFGYWEDEVAWKALSKQINKAEISRQIQLNVNLGKKASLETRQKMSKSQTGKKRSKEAIEKMKKGLTGQKRNDDFKKLMSDMRKGKTSTFKGKTHTEDSKEKTRQSIIEHWKKRKQNQRPT